MEVLWGLLAVAAGGVTYDWQPVEDSRGGVEYLVQVTPEMLEAAQTGQIDAIESNIPEGIGPIRRIRVVLGGQKSATELASNPRKAHFVAKPVVEHTVRQQVSGGTNFTTQVDPYGRPLSTAAGQLEDGFYQATNGIQSGVQQAGQAFDSAGNALSQPFTSQPAQPIAQPRKSIGSELMNGANKVGEETMRAVRNTGEMIDGTARNIGDGFKSVLPGGTAPRPAAPGSGDFVPFSYAGPSAQPSQAPQPAPAQALQMPPASGATPTGFATSQAPPNTPAPTTAPPAWNTPPPNSQVKPAWPSNQPARPPANNTEDSWVNYNNQPSASPTAGLVEVQHRTAPAAAPAANSASGWGNWQNPSGSPSGTNPTAAPVEKPFVSLIDPRTGTKPPNQGGGFNASAQQDLQPQLGAYPQRGNAGQASGNGVGGGWGRESEIAMPLLPNTAENPRPNNPATQAGYTGWSGNQPAGNANIALGPGGQALPPLENPADPLQSGPNRGFAQNQQTTGDDQQWGFFFLVFVICIGSLGGNVFLSWSYLDARNKYQSALRRTVRTFGNSGEV